MQNLIKIEKTKIGTEEVNSVNAYDIWKYLEIKTKYSDWIKKRLDQLGAVENEDYTCFPKIEKTPSGDSFRVIEYIVTLDIAKHLGMMERNQKGREIRQYFIEIEKKAIEMMYGTIEERKLRDLIAIKEQLKIFEEIFCNVDTDVMTMYKVKILKKHNYDVPEIAYEGGGWLTKTEIKEIIQNQYGIKLIGKKTRPNVAKLNNILRKYDNNKELAKTFMANAHGHDHIKYNKKIIDIIKENIEKEFSVIRF